MKDPVGMTQKVLRGNDRGFLMIAAYLVVSMVFANAMAFFSRGNSYLTTVERTKNRMIAFNMAEAGIDQAMTQIAANSLYTGASYSAMDTGSSKGGYQISVTIPVNNVNVRVVTATGYAPDNSSSSRAYESKTITTYMQISQQSGLFDYAVYAKESIQMSGNAITDSYNSSLGAYTSATAGSNGDVGTDTTRAGFAMMSGNVKVKGDFSVGPGGNPTSVLTTSGNSTITGTKTAALSLKNYTEKTTTTTSSGTLSLAGNTIQYLAAGTYLYDSFKISGNAQLVPLGAVSIYISGAIDITGNGIATVNNKPPNLTLYSSGTSVKISGNGDFYGGVYAPKASVTVTGNGSVYGAVIAKNYSQSGNGNIHFDEALGTGGSTSSSSMQMLAWKENSTSAWDTGT